MQKPAVGRQSDAAPMDDGGFTQGDFNTELAHYLVENYPTHSFVIDADEAKSESLGLQIADSNDAQMDIVDRIAEVCFGFSAIGPLVEKDRDDEQEPTESKESQNGSLAATKHKEPRGIGYRRIQGRQNDHMGISRPIGHNSSTRPMRKEGG